MRDISLDGTGRTRHGAHLPPNAWRESRSRRENRYGKHAVHMIPVPPFRDDIQGKLHVPVAFPSEKIPVTHVARCHRHVKNLHRFG
jgi:hypothetical protein